MEKLEIVCHKTGESLGIAIPREAVIRSQAWCRSTNIYVVNNQGQVLVHQRSLNKERFPGVWSTHLGGHIGEGEDYKTNALKEIEEEAGIHADPNKLVVWRTTRIDRARLWTQEFVLLHDAPIEHFIPQPGEVERFAWMTPEEILAAAQKEPHMWLAGTHDFRTEYHCFRSALITANSLGAVELPSALCVLQHLAA